MLRSRLVLGRPSEGEVSQWYGARQLQDGLPHAGQDYKFINSNGKVCRYAYAAHDGEVLWADDSRKMGWPNLWYINPDFDGPANGDQSGGNMVYIGIKDYDTGAPFADIGYGHLEEIWVKKGQWVKRGQIIGIVGESGYSAGKHLHFSLMFRPFNYATSTYGCSDPNPYFETQGGKLVLPQSERVYTDNEKFLLNLNLTLP